MAEANETREMWRDHKRGRQRASEERRDVAEESFDFLRKHAAKHGVTLKQFTDTHYQVSIRSHGWLWNIYPGNRRIYVSEHHIRAGTPRLPLPEMWTLRDVVVSAAKLWTKETGR